MTVTHGAELWCVLVCRLEVLLKVPARVLPDKRELDLDALLLCDSAQVTAASRSVLLESPLDVFCIANIVPGVGCVAVALVSRYTDRL